MPAVLRGVKLEHDGEFFYLNCFHWYSTKDKLKKHYNVCKDHDYCYVEMPNEDNRIFKHNHGEKSMKLSFVIYADLESLFERIDTCHNNPEKSSATKINKHAPSGYSLFTRCSSDATKNKVDCCRGKDCMKRFFKDLKEHATE